MIATFIVFFAAGSDLAGTVSPRESDAERLMQRLGLQSFGSLFSAKAVGKITLARDKCEGCESCRDACLLGVFGGLGPDKKIVFRDRDACFVCGACVKQCPQEALALAPQAVTTS